MSVRMYNAGDRIFEVWKYSIDPTAAMSPDIHCTAQWNMDAPAQGFFEVPIEMPNALGTAMVPVNFRVDIPRKFGDRGVILVDLQRSAEEINETEAVAATEEQAILKGRERWQGYLETVCRQHIEQCQQFKAAGNPARTAFGFTKRAFGLLGWKDPGDEVMLGITGSGEVQELRKMIASQQEMINALLKAQLEAKNGHSNGDEAKPAKARRAEAAQAALVESAAGER